MGIDRIAVNGASEPKDLDSQSEIAELKHELLRLRDYSIGLEAELKVERARMADVEKTPVGKAFARVDELEDERQALLHELRWAISSQRKVLEEYRIALEGVKGSVTWRIGNIVVTPARRLVRLVRR